MADFCHEMDHQSKKGWYPPFLSQHLMSAFDEMARVRPQVIEVVDRLENVAKRLQR
ncbi:MAG: hypothetical protein Ct9H300mP13_6200 [Gammaproteobacteria bacterium]|nr:MAG: hypothetical protein Ct9H300mP13_6200 [Gammaproteobacteria bacterium]